MSLKRPKGHAGTLVVLELNSGILKGNPLGDPHVRKLGVWLPPQYDAGRKQRFPVLYDLVGFTGSGLPMEKLVPSLLPFIVAFIPEISLFLPRAFGFIK